MTNWSHGYNVSSGYTFGFYRETAPDWLDFAIAVRGYEPPRSTSCQRFRYLELGSGQGFGLCLLAAANPEGEFYGIDFSPEHTAHARALASKLGIDNVIFLEGDFAELAAEWPSDLGRFDYAVMHGIYSWVPLDIRRALIEILKHALISGGVVYASYNSMPGWTSAIPLQHMLRQIERSGIAQGAEAIKAGRELFGQLESVGSGVTRALPSLKSRIENTAKQAPAYLVQEYLHENWHPLWSSQVLTEFAEAKLELIASATMSENLMPGILPEGFRALLADQPKLAMREDLTDCLINQSFRRDIFIRGARRRLSGNRVWQDQFTLCRLNTNEPTETIEITNAFGTVKLTSDKYNPIFDAIGDSAQSLAHILKGVSNKAEKQALLQNVLLLLHAGWLGCGTSCSDGGERAADSNRTLANLVTQGAPYRHLAAPKLGSAVSASDSEMLMLDCYTCAPEKFQSQPTVQLRKHLEQLGRSLIREGHPLVGEKLDSELDLSAKTFQMKTLPLWKDLGVVA